MDDNQKAVIYSYAERLFDNEEYSKAIEEYKKIRDWMDASAKIQTCSIRLLPIISRKLW